MTQRATDPFTGLATRVAWLQASDEVLATGAHVGMVLMDIDRFTLLNRVHGHDAGDVALRGIAARLAELDSLACRYSGDEFAILVLDGDASVVAKRVRRLTNEALAPYDTLKLRQRLPADPTTPEPAFSQPALGASVIALPRRNYAGHAAARLVQLLDERLDAARSSSGRNRVHLVEECPMALDR